MRFAIIYDIEDGCFDHGSHPLLSVGKVLGLRHYRHRGTRQEDVEHEGADEGNSTEVYFTWLQASISRHKTDIETKTSYIVTTSSKASQEHTAPFCPFTIPRGQA